MSDLQLATLCRDAYRDDFTTLHPSFTPVLEIKDVQAYWSEEKNTFVFLGSRDPLDWRRNFKRAFDRDTHSGFLLAWYPLHLQIDDAIKRSGKINVTGHSLGGALALLTLDRYREQVGNCVTFGAPRVFSASYARQVNRDLGQTLKQVRVRRYLFIDDPVGHIPLLSRWLPPWRRYSHVGKAVYLPWWPSAWTAVGRHSIDRYVTALEAA